MNIKQSVVLTLTLATAVTSNAQSLENGIKMYQYERFQTAVQELAPLATSNPLANYYLGLSELALDSTSAAKATFSRYAESDANIAGLARVAYVTGNATEGNQLVQAVANKAKKKDWEPLKYAADAINYTKGGDIQQAINWYKESLKRNDNAATHIALGDAWQKVQGGGGEAMNNYEKVIAKDPGNSLAYSRIGALWYAAKNYDLALENYQKAKDADPSNPLPYRDLANAYFWTGKYDLAKQNIEKYLERSDRSAQDMITYSNILYLAKDYDKAKKTVQDVLDKGITTPGLYGILGFSEYETGDLKNALVHVSEYFAKQDPSKITPFDMIQFGKIMLANEMPDSANYYYNAALAKDTAKDKSETYRQIAEAFKSAKDYANSATWYNKLIQNNPATDPIDYFWRGAMYYYSKQYNKAADAFREMETRYPDQPSATYWRGRVAAAIDEEAKTCEASPFYESWLEKVGPEYDKTNDLMYAYQYLALCAYNKNDKANTQKYMDKIEAIDANNAFLKQLREAVKNTKK